MVNIADFPEINPYLDVDTSENYTNTVEELDDQGDKFLIVSQAGLKHGWQLLFHWDGSKYVFVKKVPDDHLVVQTQGQVPVTPQPTFPMSKLPVLSASLVPQYAGALSAQDHATVAHYAALQVGIFSSKASPMGQNVACCWAVRNIVYKALGRWITHVDGTSEFATELAKHFGHPFTEGAVPDGGIIIAPTGSGGPNSFAHGHVGILGPRTANGDRLIYSNSSHDGLWEQNWTLNRWIMYYSTMGHLQVLFYPLPSVS